MHDQKLLCAIANVLLWYCCTVHNIPVTVPRARKASYSHEARCPARLLASFICIILLSLSVRPPGMFLEFGKGYAPVPHENRCREAELFCEIASVVLFQNIIVLFPMAVFHSPCFQSMHFVGGKQFQFGNSADFSTSWWKVSMYTLMMLNCFARLPASFTQFIVLFSMSVFHFACFH